MRKYYLDISAAVVVVVVAAAVGAAGGVVAVAEAGSETGCDKDIEGKHCYYDWL